MMLSFFEALASDDFAVTPHSVAELDKSCTLGFDACSSDLIDRFFTVSSIALKALAALGITPNKVC